MTAFMRQWDQIGVMCHILACLRHAKVLVALVDADCFNVDLNLGEEPDAYDLDSD